MSEKFTQLVELMARLCGEGGCPWDIEQTHESLKPCLVEETYETLDAIDSGDADRLKDELGDVLLQVVFHARIADNGGRFDIDDVCQAICEKLVRRHPHVFADVRADTPDEVIRNWVKIKRGESAHQSRKSLLDGVPVSMPALLRARKIQGRASAAGFDWADAGGAMEKLDEEVAELKSAIKKNDNAHAIEELGDLLFSVVNVSRFMNADPEAALRGAIKKFRNRFGFMERRLEEREQEFGEMSFEQMDALWNEAKDSDA